MLKTIIIVLAIVLLLTFIMFFLLKRVVETINAQTKVFFMMKLQSYDELIDEKEKELKEIKIENMEEQKEAALLKQKEQLSVVIPEENPEYEIKGLVEVIKKIEKEFNYDSKTIIQQFINFAQKEDTTYYQKLIAIKACLDEYGVYNLAIKNDEEQQRIIEQLNISQTEVYNIYNSNYKKFDINNFLKILEFEIGKFDPTIYVFVGDEDENYDSYYGRIKTIFDKTILKGVKIKFHNVIYEYNL